MTCLSWGIADDKLKELHPDIVIAQGHVRCKSVTLRNFPGDCGTLILTYANYANVESLKLAEGVASDLGFNKIFATVVCAPEYAETAAQAFKKCRWKLVHKGNSNRTESNASYVFVKIIHNCKYKGY